MLTQVALRFGSSVGQPTLAIDPSPITIFVGPNNSGKSLILREIDTALSNPDAKRVIIDKLSARQITQAELDAVIRARGQKQSSPGQPDSYSVNRLRPGASSGPPGEITITCQRDASGQWKIAGPAQANAATRTASLLTVFLDGRTRLSLLDDAKTGSLHAPPQNHLAALFRNDVTRARISQLTNEVFDEFFTIDATSMTEFQAKLAPRAPADVSEERGNDDRAIAFHTNTRHISAYSDGVKAYIGLLSAVTSSVFKLILIDEPEAFLHPPLARRIGRHIADLASTEHACVIVATHDADFVMGAIQAGPGVNVVRLTYRGGVATARHLPAQNLTDLMRDPLLRSAGVIRSLFHAAAVICEGDKDRAFYEEINDRVLSASNNTDGVSDGLFLNVQNKQTVRRVIGPLRAMGIPAVAVVDLDVLKDDDLEQLLDAAYVPASKRAELSALIANVQAEFARCKAQPEATGLPLLDEKARRDLDALLGELGLYGVFVVPVGEVEDWLEGLGVKSGKRNWLPKIFESMGSDPMDAAYVKPGANDVWKFLRSIGKWTRDPNREGIPA